MNVIGILEVIEMFRVEEIARWFLLRNNIEQQKDECIEFISNLKLQKLLYYAQGIHLAVTGEILFEEDVLAWKSGPVVQEVYDMYKVNKAETIKINREYCDQCWFD